MEGAYLFLLIIILSGYLFTKNIGINILQCVIVCALFGGSQDPLDFYNYEDIYNTVKQGYDVSYEIGYVWLNDICGKLGCSYIEFRYIAGILFCSCLINNHKKTDGTSECSMEFLPYFLSDVRCLPIT